MKYLAPLIILLTACNPDLAINGHDQFHEYEIRGLDVVVNSETRYSVLDCPFDLEVVDGFLYGIIDADDINYLADYETLDVWCDYLGIQSVYAGSITIVEDIEPVLDDVYLVYDKGDKVRYTLTGDYLTGGTFSYTGSLGGLRLSPFTGALLETVEDCGNHKAEVTVVTPGGDDTATVEVEVICD